MTKAVTEAMGRTGVERLVAMASWFTDATAPKENPAMQAFLDVS